MTNEIPDIIAHMTDSDARQAFGPNGAAVRNFILSLEAYPWFQHVGRTEPWDRNPDIVRVYSWEEAWTLLPSTNTTYMAALRTARGIRDMLQRVQPEEAWEKRYVDADYYAHELVASLLRVAYGDAAGKAATHSGCASSELVLQGVVADPPHFFLDLMRYWEKGHWPLGVREDGRLIVF